MKKIMRNICGIIGIMFMILTFIFIILYFNRIGNIKATDSVLATLGCMIFFSIRNAIK